MRIQYLKRIGVYSVQTNDDAAYFLNFLTNKIIQVPTTFCEASNHISDAYLEILRSEGIVFHDSFSYCFEGDYKPTSVTLLMTTRCNLNCIYCYAYNHCNKDLSFDAVKIAVDFLIKNAVDKRTNTITIRFHGLGEPTLNFGVLKKTVEYAKSQCAKHSLFVIFHITTNGVMEDNQRDFLIKNMHYITLSIDGTRPFQNSQRSLVNGDSFCEATKTLNAVSDKEHLLIRTTVTNGNLGNLEEWCEYLDRIGVKHINVEPVSICGNCLNNGVADLNQSFCKVFADLCGRFKRMKITYSCFRRGSRSFHCGAFGANMVVTPFGDISTCYECFDTTNESHALFIVGKILDGAVHIDNQKIRALAEKCKALRNECSNCYAQTFCNGSCLSKRYQSFIEKGNSYSMVLNKCKISRRIVLDKLRERISHKISFTHSEMLF